MKEIRKGEKIKGKEREKEGKRKGNAKKRSKSDKAQLRSLYMAANPHDALLGPPSTIVGYIQKKLKYGFGRSEIRKFKIRTHK